MVDRAGREASAQPLNAQADDACGNCRIDNTGQKLLAPNTAANSNGNCW